jgi:hypothetical protein
MACVDTILTALKAGTTYLQFDELVNREGKKIIGDLE